MLQYTIYTVILYKLQYIKYNIYITKSIIVSFLHKNVMFLTIFQETGRRMDTHFLADFAVGKI